ncbi:hypothetical protein [Deinococcus cellulosilyticus]|uniref:Uncharacterized protein n=1 Tax=Deinococcus cellulosilyticus (strain DSM 18568 / NBRC 106333 / KACC 11606 / 5516J-15) TaxID=1223518 RepID=A0A511N7T3_DEIC1|nr:hypothetical protein [Deinococcus cellulosilyticus]GEM48567.1 hypothetical protein DC3_42020 [Deinococcus cellulosilyticus NBRC 106333 = KACC 11606]
MKKALITLLLLCAPVAFAQTAAELVVVTAIASTLDSSVSLPRGTYKYTNPQTAQKFAQNLGADASKYQNYEMYVATGIIAKLAPGFVQQLETNFAAAGYFKASSSSNATTTRSEFSNDEGKTLLLFTVYQKDTVYFLVGRKK